jgi:hypothetical protein
MEAMLNGPFGSVPLGSSNVKIGRALDNHIVLLDSKVSAHHAELRATAQGYSIVDLASTNGTYVNEQLVKRNVPYTLCHLDTIRFGDTLCLYTVPVVSSITPTAHIPPSNIPPTIPVFVHQQDAVGYRTTQPLSGGPTTSLLSNATGSLPEPQIKQRSSGMRWLFSVVAGVFLVMLVVGVTLACLSWASLYGPARVLHAYCEALKNQDYQSAYAYFDEATQKMLSTADYSSSASSNGGAGQVIDCAVSNIHVQGTQATGSILYTYANRSTFSGEYILQQQNKEWRIRNGANSTPQLTLAVYCSALHRQDYASAYHQLSSDTKKSMSQNVFTHTIKLAGIAGCNLTGVQISGIYALTLLTYDNRSGHGAVYNARLINEDFGWYLNDQQPD